MTSTAKNRSNYRIGQDNISIWGMDIHNPVFAISAGVITLFVMLSLFFPDTSFQWLSDVKAWCLSTFDSFIMGSVSLIFLFCCVLLVSPAGKIKFGGEDAKPEFSMKSWLAMLFAAGMGIGLLFWGTAEPIAYFSGWGGTPLNTTPFSEEAAALAVPTSVYHWGIQAWAIYGLVGVSLAHVTFNGGLPLSIRSAFYPLLGERVWGWPGHLIDIIAVLSTIFGLVTSMGLGAIQANSGLHLLFDIPNNYFSQVIIIIAVTAVAIFSVIRGLDGGVKLLSNINMILAFCLLLFVLLAGPTLELLKATGTNTFQYLVNLPQLSNWMNRPDESWMQGWSVFYWAWWVSWSPFVGVFIARISKGRTIRELLLAVLIVPTLVTILWMTTFGHSAVLLAQNGIGELAKGITDPTLTTFQLLAELPFPQISSFITVVLILVFFVTSADSGALVVDSITAGGKMTSPARQRIFWASTIGVIAIVLLVIGGNSVLNALQSGTVATGIPFTVVLLLMAVALIKSLFLNPSINQK